jgi:hypothetical protein
MVWCTGTEITFPLYVPLHKCNIFVHFLHEVYEMNAEGESNFCLFSLFHIFYGFGSNVTGNGGSRDFHFGLHLCETILYISLKCNMCVEKRRYDCSVAYLRHVRIVTTKHAPAIMQ